MHVLHVAAEHTNTDARKHRHDRHLAHRFIVVKRANALIADQEPARLKHGLEGAMGAIRLAACAPELLQFSARVRHGNQVIHGRLSNPLVPPGGGAGGGVAS